MSNLNEIEPEIKDKVLSQFKKDSKGRRPIFVDIKKTPGPMSDISPSFRKQTSNKYSNDLMSPSELYQSGNSGEMEAESSDDNNQESDDQAGDAEDTNFGDPVNGDGQDGDQDDPNKKGKEEAKKLEDETLQGDKDGTGSTDKTEGQPAKPQDEASSTPQPAPLSDKERLEMAESDPETAKKLGVKKQNYNEYDKSFKGRIQKEIGQVRDRIDEIKQKFSIKENAKKAAKALAKKFWQWLLATIGPWGIVAIIAILLIGIILLAIFASNDDRGRGKTRPTPTEIVKEEDWITKLLMYSGDKDTITANVEKAKADLTEALTKVSTDPDVAKEDQDKAKALLDKVDQLPNSLADIQKGINELIDKYRKSIPGENGKFSGMIDFVSKGVRTVSPDIIKKGGYTGKSNKGRCDDNETGCHYEVYRPKAQASADKILTAASSAIGNATLPDYHHGGELRGYRTNDHQCAAIVYFALRSSGLRPNFDGTSSLNSDSLFEHLNANDSSNPAIQRGDILHFFDETAKGKFDGYSFNRSGHGHWAIAY